MSKDNQQRLGRASNRPLANCAGLVAVQNFMTRLDDRDIAILEWITAEIRLVKSPSQLN
jgi:hypothetical protein